MDKGLLQTKPQHLDTTDMMNSMKELFSDVLQTVMEAELEDKLG